MLPCPWSGEGPQCLRCWTFTSRVLPPLDNLKELYDMKLLSPCGASLIVRTNGFWGRQPNRIDDSVSPSVNGQPMSPYSDVGFGFREWGRSNRHDAPGVSSVAIITTFFGFLQKNNGVHDI